MTDQQTHRFERGTDGLRVIVGVDGSDSSLRAGAYAAGSPGASTRWSSAPPSRRGTGSQARWRYAW